MEFRRLRHGYTNRTVGDGPGRTQDLRGTGRRAAARTGAGRADPAAGRVPLPPVRAVRRTDARAGVRRRRARRGPHRGRARDRGAACVRDGTARDPTASTRTPGGGCSCTATTARTTCSSRPRTAPRVTAVLDWEFAHLGDPVEDLAWCEWLVRTHHPEHVGALGRVLRRVRRAGAPVGGTPQDHAQPLPRAGGLLRELGAGRRRGGRVARARGGDRGVAGDPTRSGGRNYLTRQRHGE